MPYDIAIAKARQGRQVAAGAVVAIVAEVEMERRSGKI
jgi:hypothetical protein